MFKIQFPSTLVLQVLALAASALAIQIHGQTQSRTVADVQVFQGIPLFGTCCHEFRENGDCKNGTFPSASTFSHLLTEPPGDNATQSFAEPSGFTQFACGDTERNAGTPVCCKTIKTHGERLIPDKAWKVCTVNTVL
ncbi:hypothetical protein DL98DRAFT_533538 [Cadophora sp. DSE1049]|nr:hypothetical protein DL98DRAFT_533538 [Cadophora sp. DSE1049]